MIRKVLVEPVPVHDVEVPEAGNQAPVGDVKQETENVCELGDSNPNSARAKDQGCDVDQ